MQSSSISSASSLELGDDLGDTTARSLELGAVERSIGEEVKPTAGVHVTPSALAVERGELGEVVTIEVQRFFDDGLAAEIVEVAADVLGSVGEALELAKRIVSTKRKRLETPLALGHERAERRMVRSVTGV